MEEQKGTIEWANSLTKIVGLVGALSLVSSVVYDWGFFRAANLSFLEVPSSISDHVRSSLVWLPEVLAVVWGLSAYELFLRRVEGGMTEEEIVSSSNNPEKTRKFRESPKYGIVAIAILALIAYFLVGDIFVGYITMPLIVFWVLFSAWVNSHPRIQQRRHPLVRVAIHWLPPVVIWLVSIGYSNCEALMKGPPGQLVYYEVSPKEGVEVNILRHLERGVLLKEKDAGGAAFVKWTEVVRIEQVAKRAKYRGILAKYVPRINVLYDNMEESSVSKTKGK